jgi:hypothetical protein
VSLVLRRGYLDPLEQFVGIRINCDVYGMKMSLFVEADIDLFNGIKHKIPRQWSSACIDDVPDRLSYITERLNQSGSHCFFILACQIHEGGDERFSIGATDYIRMDRKNFLNRCQGVIDRLGSRDIACRSCVASHTHPDLAYQGGDTGHSVYHG